MKNQKTLYSYRPLLPIPSVPAFNCQRQKYSSTDKPVFDCPPDDVRMRTTSKSFKISPLYLKCYENCILY